MNKLTTDDPIVIPAISENRSIEINPIDYAIRANANLGIKETGKSYAGGWFAEQLMKRGIPITVISPSPGRVWRHLKIGRPGYHGFPVVIVGDDDDADLPLSRDTAADIMRAAMEEGISVVFDVFSSRLTKTDFREVVKTVSNVLTFENENYGLRHLFLEEASRVIPQAVYDRVTYGAVEQLITVGGNSGVGITLMNPRAEGVNKEALELCEGLFLFKQTGRNSITNLSKWLKNVDAGNRLEVEKSLARLEKGVCWYWDATDAPPVLLSIPQKDTVHPDRRALTGKAVTTKQGTDVTTFVSRMTKALAKKVVVEEKLIAPAGWKDATTPPSHPVPMDVAERNAKLFDAQQKIIELEQKLAKKEEQLRTANNEIANLESTLTVIREELKPQYDMLRRVFGEVENVQFSANGGNDSYWKPFLDKLGGGEKRVLEVLIDRKRLNHHQLRLLASIGAKRTLSNIITSLVGKGLIKRDGKDIVLKEI